MAINFSLSPRLLIALSISIAIHLPLSLILHPGTAHDDKIKRRPLLAQLKSTIPFTQPKTADAVPPAPPSLLENTDNRSVAIQETKPEENALMPELNSGSKGLMPERHYFNHKELDQRPRPLHSISPSYPEGSEQLEIVVLRLLISEQGSVEEIEVLTAGVDERFARNATNAFRSARFSPGIRKGLAVPSSMLIEVIFDPADIQANWEKNL